MARRPASTSLRRNDQHDEGNTECSAGRSHLLGNPISNSKYEGLRHSASNAAPFTRPALHVLRSKEPSGASRANEVPALGFKDGSATLKSSWIGR